MRCRKAFSMVEVMAVVVVLATAALGASMLAPLPAMRSMEAGSESRELMAAMRASRQAAMATSTPFRIRFQETGGQVTTYVVERNLGGNFTPVQPSHVLPTLPLRTTSSSEITFLPTGGTDRSLTVRFGNGKQVHEVTIASANGLVRYTKK